jgi:hypothetical protein
MVERTDDLDLRTEALRVLREVEESSEFIESRWDKVEFQAAQARAELSYRRLRRLSEVLAIIATAVPIAAATPIARALAGQRTALNISVALGIVLTVVLLTAGFALWRKVRLQQAELKRVREYTAELEARFRETAERPRTQMRASP